MNITILRQKKKVTKLLGNKCKMTIAKKIIVYLAVIFILFLLPMIIKIKIFLLNNEKGKKEIKVLLWVLSFVFNVIVSLLIVIFYI